MQNCGIRYNGSKGKCSKMLRTMQSIIDSHPSHNPLVWFPFCGACKDAQFLKHCRRLCSDIDEPIISLLTEVRRGWDPPTKVSEKEYERWKERKVPLKYPGYKCSPMLAFVGYGCSFGARYFEGYARSRKGEVNFAASARRALINQKPYLRDVNFRVGDYKEVDNWMLEHEFDPHIIICDPPYEGTKPCGSLKIKFDNKAFWKWAVKQTRHSIVLVNEYTCPVPGARIIWEQKTAAGIRFGTSGHGGNKGSGKSKLERLYLLNPESKIGLGIL